MSDDVYQSTVAGGLKLKGVKNAGIKKKKKKKKNKAENVDSMASTSEQIDQNKQEKQKDEEIDSRTPAEIAFDKAQEKSAADRILKKAAKTHKQRVEDLNQYLDGLSEHYDIQKVSWTK